MRAVKIQSVGIVETFKTVAFDDASTVERLDGYQVEAVHEDGKRWQHTHVFASKTSATRFVRIVAKGMKIHPDLSCWCEVNPVYGSMEYQKQDCEYFEMLREREDARWER